MRRFPVFLTVVAVVLLGSAVTLSRPPAAAQEATPVTETTLQGATVEAGAFAPVPRFPPEPAVIGIVRVRFSPGGRLLVPPDEPGMAMHFLDSGTMTIHFSTPVVVVRGETQTRETIPANTTFTLRAGDAFVAPSPSGGEYRNDGAEDAVLWFAPVGPDEAATPTP
jgi:hypothetical protein